MDLFIQATVVTNERDGGEFALVELTDGHHWVPAIASIPVLEDGLGYAIVVSLMHESYKMFGYIVGRISLASSMHYEIRRWYSMTR